MGFDSLKLHRWVLACIFSAIPPSKGLLTIESLNIAINASLCIGELESCIQLKTGFVLSYGHLNKPELRGFLNTIAHYGWTMSAALSKQLRALGVVAASTGLYWSSLRIRNRSSTCGSPCCVTIFVRPGPQCQEPEHITAP